MITNLWNRIVAATKAKKYVWQPIDQGPALASDGSYVRIFISEMWLETTWKWFSGWYPAVEASVQLKFGDQPATVITRVAKPPENATKNAVLRNYEILPLTPFNGGTLELQAALLAMQGEKYLSTAIDILEDFSSLVAAPLGQVLAIAEKVSSGLDTIVSATNGDARLPYHDTFVGAGMGANELKTGYLALIRAEPHEIVASQLSVKDGALLYNAEPFRQCDYLLLRIDGSVERDDYRQLSAIKTPYDELIKTMEELQAGDAGAVTRAENKVRSAIFRCADLAARDRARVWDALKKEIADAKQAFGLGAAGIPARSLDDIVATWAVPMAHAAALADQGADSD
jgi:hypothetical protein